MHNEGILESIREIQSHVRCYSEIFTIDYFAILYGSLDNRLIFLLTQKSNEIFVMWKQQS